MKQSYHIRYVAVFIMNILQLQFVFSQSPKGEQVSIHVKEQPVETVFEIITQQTGIHFFYSETLVKRKHTVTLSVDEVSVNTVLRNITRQTNLTFLREENTISVKLPTDTNSYAKEDIKTIKVKGLVNDPDGFPLPFANIVQKDSPQNGAITDVYGWFEITVPYMSHIVISYMGYISQEIEIRNSGILNIRLAENSEVLSDIVVIALGVEQTEKALGYSVQRIEGKEISRVKGVESTSALTGKIAGLNIKNSTEFTESPSISLRGYSPLLVVDGIPFYNVRLGDIPADDIETIDVLKGSTASALYGSRGGAGAIMVTTKKASQEGLVVTVNSNTMVHAGYLKQPQFQTSYSSGSKGKYATGDYVWGDRLDIGRTAMQYDPYTYQMVKMPLVSKGKNNLKNFLETALVTNNNANISQRGKYGGSRLSLTHVYNKGQYPNTNLNKFTFSVSGDVNWKSISLEAGITYNKSYYPNNLGTGYGVGSFLYNLLIWSGADYDIRDYRNYWKTGKEQTEQNWMDETWYDNPYFLAYERTNANHYDLGHNFLDLKYKATSWLNATLRVGSDIYRNRYQVKQAISSRNNKKGSFSQTANSGYSINGDLFLYTNHKFKDFTLDSYWGGSLYFRETNNQSSSTSNGLSIPGFYSIYASVDPPVSSSATIRQQTNSLFAKLSSSWKRTFFIEVTGRKDWVSTLEKSERSYFYPSVSGSVILSELISLPQAVNFWKIRAAWNQTKHPAAVGAINRTYSLYRNYWGNMVGTSLSTTIRDTKLMPQTSDSYELGMVFHLFNNMLELDLAFYNKREYNLQSYARVSHASGFSDSLINSEEEQLSRGFEIVANCNLLKTDVFQWTSTLNYALDRYYYHKIDLEYSTKRPWVKEKANWYWLDINDWERDPDGNIIHYNGLPRESDYTSLAGYTNPKWIWGWTNNLSYKNFNLNFSFDGRVGGVMFNYMDQRLWHSGRHIDSDNQWRHDEVVNGKKNYIGNGVKIVSGNVRYDSDGNLLEDTRVFAPNDVPTSYESYVRIYQGNNKPNNLETKTFFKLRELSFGYSFCKSACEKMKLKEAEIALVGQNLLMWSKEFRFSDPEIDRENINSPSIRYVGLNLKMSF